MPNQVLFEIKSATLKKWMWPTFVAIDWVVSAGQNWAVVGPNGAGKSILAEAIAGKGWVSEGRIDYPLVGRPMDSTVNLQDYITYLSFTEKSRNFDYANHYYQQRFQSTEADEAITVSEFLFGKQTVSLADPLLSVLDIEPLLKLHFIKLSNGQTRRVRLAKAVLEKPKLLIVDNFFTGLDKKTREKLAGLLNQLTSKGLNLILLTSAEQLPDCISHVLEVDDFKILGKWNKDDYLAKPNKAAQQKRGRGALNAIFSLPPTTEDFDFENAVKMADVWLTYKDKTILKGINWTVKKGEKWALTGPNGSGKTSLLSLIYADNPQAYSQQITLFDRRKGSGESIWQIKSKIGFISAELFTYFRSVKTALEVMATGYTDTLVLQHKITTGQKEEITHFLDFFGLKDCINRPYRHLSTGEQRMVLFIRSLIKNPPLIIMDEPFQGLDPGMQERCLELLEMYCHKARTLIYVSHYEHEIPQFVNHRIALSGGKAKIDNKTLGDD